MKLTKKDAINIFREIGKIQQRDFEILSGGRDFKDWDIDAIIGIATYNILFLRGEFKSLDYAHEKVLQAVRDIVTQSSEYPKIRRHTTRDIYKLIRDLERDWDADIPDSEKSMNCDQ
jgi:hypothetical protein